MKKVSVTLPEELVDDLDDRVDTGEYDTRSEAVRARLQEADRVPDLEDDLEHLEARRDELERNLSALRAREEDVEELVAYVEDERRVRRRREERRRQRRRASVLERAKWWVAGEPDELGEQ